MNLIVRNNFNKFYGHIFTYIKDDPEFQKLNENSVQFGIPYTENVCPIVIFRKAKSNYLVESSITKIRSQLERILKLTI